MIKRNPGVTLLWVTKKHRLFKAGNGYLFDIGEPKSMHWYSRGRFASHKEVIDSIESGCPILRGEAEKEGVEAVTHYENQKAWLLNKIQTDFQMK